MVGCSSSLRQNGSFSHTASLEKEGFEKFDSYTSAQISDEIEVECDLFGKKVYVGESISFGKWGILLAQKADNYVYEDYELAKTEPPEIIVVNQNLNEDYYINGRTWQGIPSIEVTKGDRLWASWFSGGEKEPCLDNYAIYAYSDDNGNHWTEPVVIVRNNNEKIRVYDPNVWVDPDGRLWIFFNQEAGLNAKTAVIWGAVCENPDADKLVFSKPKMLASGLTVNKPVVLKDGTWLISTYIFGRKGTPINVYASTDKGQKWVLRGTVPSSEDDDCNENMIIEKANGELWMLARFSSRNSEDKAGIRESISTDGGENWTQLSQTNKEELKGPGSRFFIRRLASGNLLLINHYKYKGRNNLCAMISEDDGQTWLDNKLLLDDRIGVSYPDATQDSDGMIYAIHDYNRYKEKEIVMDAFTEQDIIDGKFNSTTAQQHVVISPKSYSYNIVLKKTNGKGLNSVLSGAKFEIKKSTQIENTTSELKGTVETVRDGNEKMTVGRETINQEVRELNKVYYYKIEEIESPNGYKDILNKKKILVAIYYDSEGNIKLGTPGTYTDYLSVAYNQNPNKITIGNNEYENKFLIVNEDGSLYNAQGDDKFTDNLYNKISVIIGNSAQDGTPQVWITVPNPEKTLDLEATLKYSKTSITNEDVTVTITANKEIQEVEGWDLANDKMTLTKIYKKNCAETLKITDLAGNIKYVPISVGNIDKVSPVAIVGYSKTSLTNNDVIVTVTLNEAIQEVKGWSLSENGKILTKIYTNNVSEKVEVKDLAGNSKTFEVSIKNIDKVPIITNVEYSTKDPTNQDVVVTITSNKELQAILGWTISDNKKTLTKTYTKNGTETLEVKDLAGNSKEVEILVNNINKSTLSAEIDYSTDKLTNKDVIVTITASEELQKVKSWSLSEDKRTLTKKYMTNKSEKITITDLAGNSKVILVNVNNIDKTSPKIAQAVVNDISSKGFILNINGKDEESGLSEMRIYVDNELKKTYRYTENVLEEKQETYMQDNLNQITRYSVYIEVEDKAGNITSTKDSMLNVLTDRVPSGEEINIILDPNTWSKENATVTISPKYILPEEYKIQYAVFNTNNDIITDWANYENPFELDNNNVIKVRITDGKNIGTEITYEITNIDKTAPVILEVFPSNITSKSFDLNLTVKDGESGTYKIRIYINNELKKEYEYSMDLNSEKSEVFIVDNLTQNTNYIYYIEVEDKSGNIISTKKLNSSVITGIDNESNSQDVVNNDNNIINKDNNINTSDNIYYIIMILGFVILVNFYITIIRLRENNKKNN